MEVKVCNRCQRLNRGDNLEVIMSKYKGLIDGVVESYYSMYKDYVEKCDLYGQAHLALAEVYASDLYSKKNMYSSIKRKMVSYVEGFCKNEALSFTRRCDADNSVSNLRNQLVQDKLLEALEHVNTRSAELLRMIILDGMNLTEIAQVWGVSANTVSVQFNKALLRIRRSKSARSICEQAMEIIVMSE